MAKKKATPKPPEKPKVQRTNVGTSLRLSPRCHDGLERLSAHYGIGKNGAVELAIMIALDTLDRSSPAAMDRIAETIPKKSRRKSGESP